MREFLANLFLIYQIFRMYVAEFHQEEGNEES